VWKKIREFIPRYSRSLNLWGGEKVKKNNCRQKRNVQTKHFFEGEKRKKAVWKMEWQGEGGGTKWACD